MLSQILDDLIAFAAQDEPELVRGKEEWAEKAGKVLEDDVLFEERTAAFLEWHVLERATSGGPPPAAAYLRRPEIDPGQAKWVAALLTSHRSLFEVRQVSEKAILLEDLLQGGLFQVTERRRLPGIEPGGVFEARLVADVVAFPELLFTRAFQFHPEEARDPLKQQAAQAKQKGESRTEVLFRLARLRVRALRYKHVAAAKIYAEPEPNP